MRTEPRLERSEKLLLIACSCCPVIIGDLLSNDNISVISNLANIVPPFVENGPLDIAASIEYAVAIQGTRRIIVCGHSPCAVLENVWSPPKISTIAVAKWLAHSSRPSTSGQGETTLDCKRKLVEANVVLQMGHLRTHPVIAQKLDNGDLTVSGWVLLEDEGLVAEYDAEKKVFLLLTQKLPPRLFTRPN